MLILLGLMAVPMEVDAPLKGGMDKVPVEYDTVDSTEIRIAVSDSVRAATWDMLTIKPARPVHVRMACIVLDRYGAPGACVPASQVPPGQDTIDWPSIVDDDRQAGRSGNPSEAELHRVAGLRISAARTSERPATKNLFVIRFFEEVVSPTDARPPFAPGDALTMQDVVLARPIDRALMQVLYPAVAMRYSVNARVTMTCRIEPSLKLLCRDPGAIVTEPGDIGTLTPTLIKDLRFSTYQLASTIALAPKGRDGQDIVGKDVKFSIRWQLP